MTISEFESALPEPMQGPAEMVFSLTESGELVQMPRNVPRLGHSPEMRGNTATSGAPTGWASTLPDPMALPQSDVKVGRNKKGTTLKVRGIWPTHKVTVGDPHYVDPIVDAVATLTDCSEIGLQRAADALLSRHADRYGLEWPRLLGSKHGHSEQLPERIPTDRSSGGATSSDDDDFHEPRSERRFVAQTTFKRRRGKVTSSTELIELQDDECGPRPVTLPLVTDRNGSSEYGDHGTSIRDRHVARSFIRRANRLRQCSNPKSHKDGCRCQHDAAGIAVLGTSVTFDAQGTAREVQLLGRRTAVATECVAWADGGYWLGHKFIADAVRAPKVAKVASARVAANDRKRKQAKRDAARASDQARLDAILGR